jgi:hypothetical protein
MLHVTRCDAPGGWLTPPPAAQEMCYRSRKSRKTVQDERQAGAPHTFCAHRTRSRVAQLPVSTKPPIAEHRPQSPRTHHHALRKLHHAPPQACSTLLQPRSADTVTRHARTSDRCGCVFVSPTARPTLLETPLVSNSSDDSREEPLSNRPVQVLRIRGSVRLEFWRATARRPLSSSAFRATALRAPGAAQTLCSFARYHPKAPRYCLRTELQVRMRRYSHTLVIILHDRGALPTAFTPENRSASRAP